ncbi:hypothetical protein IMZ48_05100, partial [Candidatus Bathyarchaeota archaeon]|nr:hypothetical protein [Candidatus Bathyarchaeota archaeon]
PPLPDLPDFVATAEMSSESPDASAPPLPPGPFDNGRLVVAESESRIVRLQTADGMELIPNFVSERLEYLFEYLPKTPRVLVDTLGTPWCHPAVFKDVTPGAYEGGTPPRLAGLDLLLTGHLDLLSSCALYTSMNRTNKPIIMRILLSRTRDLAASEAPSTLHEALARTLALTVYHIMALLDGDIEARATAETTLPTLEAAAESLIPHANLGAEHTYPATLPLYPLAETDAFWKTWVLTESIRRTMLFSHQFMACYSLLRGASSVDCAAMSRHKSWTLAAPLWHADNAVDFAVAWGGKNRWLMDMVNTDGAFEGAVPEDVCQFGRMVMTCFMGRQQARGWFASRGEVF